MAEKLKDSGLDAKKTFAIVALVIALIGVAIFGWQYFSKHKLAQNEQARKMLLEEYDKKNAVDDWSAETLLNDKDWISREITLRKDLINYMKIEGPTYSCLFIIFNKRLEIVHCGKNFEGVFKEGLEESGGDYGEFMWFSKNFPLCDEAKFEPYDKDEKVTLIMPKQFQKEYKLTLINAE